MVLMFCISLRDWKVRSGCSTSLSMRWAYSWWDAAIASVDERILSHGAWKTLLNGYRQCSVTGSEGGIGGVFGIGIAGLRGRNWVRRTLARMRHWGL